MTESLAIKPGNNNQPLQGLEVAVIGGSVSGLSAAIFLGDAGADVQVYERAPGKLSRRGSGLFLRPEARRSLSAQGISLSPVSSPVETWRRIAANQVTERPWRGEATTWDHLQATLRGEVNESQYHTGHELTGLDIQGQKPKAHFGNGTDITADLIVIADGAGSTGRSLLNGPTTPTYAGYIAWRGMTPISILGEEIQENFEGKVTEFLGQENRIMGFCVPGNPASNGKASTITHLDWNWCINAPQEALPALLGERFASSGLLPPGKIDPHVTAWLHTQAQNLLPADFKKIVTETEFPFARSVIDHPPTRMVWSGVAAVGDAAAAVRPHTGAASSKAIGDAAALTECLIQARHLGGSRQALQRGLEMWEQQRLPFAQQVSTIGQRRGAKLNLGFSAWGAASPYRGPTAINPLRRGI